VGLVMQVMHFQPGTGLIDRGDRRLVRSYAALAMWMASRNFAQASGSSAHFNNVMPASCARGDSDNGSAGLDDKFQGVSGRVRSGIGVW
jgi:hypothetical protein